MTRPDTLTATGDPCSRCGGTGTVPIVGGTKDCPKCDGSGYEK